MSAMSEGNRMKLAALLLVLLPLACDSPDSPQAKRTDDSNTPAAPETSKGDPAEENPGSGSAEAAANSARQRDIEQAIKQARAELNQAGGWDAWAQKLVPFRAGVREATRGKWPWPAKKDFVFQGKAVRLMLADEVPTRSAVHPREVIVDLHEQLRERNIDLILVLVPDKLSVYPDYLCDRVPDGLSPNLAVKKFMLQLLEDGVEVVDLHRVMARRRQQDNTQPLYYDRDSHWRNRGARLAAAAIAERLGRYDFIPNEDERLAYATREHTRTDGHKADHVQIVVRQDTGQTYQGVDDSPVILTGDSFSMYNMHLEGHLPAHVARHIGMPLTYLCQSGLGPTVPVELARLERSGGYLQGRRVVVWTFVTRSLLTDSWRKATLPGGASSQGDDIESARATCVVEEVSPRPRTDADYPDYVMKLRAGKLTGPNAKPLAGGQAVVHVLAMKDRKLLEVAKVRVGDRLEMTVTSWSKVQDTHGRTASGSLDDPETEASLPHLWAEKVQIVQPQQRHRQ
jgi:hypothetical protein